MSKFVVRHNFETNSSSMHSLSFRKTDGEYTAEELKHSEAMVGTHYSDAIITLKEGKKLTEEEIREEGWIFRRWTKDDAPGAEYMHFWSHDLELACSAMQIMSTFRDKLVYAFATACGYRYNGWEKRRDEIKDVFAKTLPGVELDARLEDDGWGMRSINTNQYLLYPFLKKNNITIEEFLINSKYIVIVNYAEYEKMKWLGMVDESQIEDVFRHEIDDTFEMKIEDGVWKLASCDINFGRYPFRVLGTPEGKARYALAAYHSKNIDEILEIMQEVYPEMKSIELPKDSWSDDGLDHGYNEDCVIPDNVTLREFILNKKYVAISDGDEYCIWSGFKNTPLFNKDEYPDEEIEDRY